MYKELFEYEYLYIIENNLESFIINNNLEDIYNNIKNYIICCELLYYNLNNIMYIEERSTFFQHLFSYFTNNKNSQIGRLINIGIVAGDLGSFALLKGGFGSGIGLLLTKLGLASSAVSIIAPLTPMIVLIIGFAINNYLTESERRNTVKLIETSSKLSVIINTKINPQINLNSYLNNQCKNSENKDEKMKCAGKLFMDSFNNEIGIPLIIGSINYLKTNRFDLSEIRTFTDLLHVKRFEPPTFDKVFRNFLYFYSNVIRIFAKDNPEIVGKTYSLLNSVIKKNVNSNNIQRR